MQASTPIALGIDIGGTKISAGLVDRNGNLVGTVCTIPTHAREEGEKIIDRLTRLVSKLTRQADGQGLTGIGVGCTGPLDIDRGVILECNNLPTLHHYPLKKQMEKAFGLPVRMNNDANALILGEALWGAGKKANRILGVTLGTGIGAALVEDKKIVRGANGCAGEIWISPYREGIIEDYVSGTALSRLYRELTQTEKSGVEIAALARQGDEHALHAWGTFTQALAYALAWCVNLTDPDAVVIGGSVVQSADLYWTPLEEQLKRHVCPEVANRLRLRKASLGTHAGLIGAAALLFVE